MTELTTTLVGANFRPQEAKDMIKGMKIGEGLALEPEPGNEYDDHAVRVLYFGEHIGYIPKTDNAELHEALVAGEAHSCTVVGFESTLKPTLEIAPSL